MKFLIGLQHSTSQILIKFVLELGGRQLKCFPRGLNIVGINVTSGWPLKKYAANVFDRRRLQWAPRARCEHYIEFKNMSLNFESHLLWTKN